MDQETITTEAPGIDSGADTNAGILTEADLASSFLERVDEQPEEKPSETEATDQTSDTVGAEAEEDSEGNVLSINRVLLRLIGVSFNQRPAIHHSLNPSVRNFCNNTNPRCSDLLCRRVPCGPNSSLSGHPLLGHRSTGACRFHFCSTHSRSQV